MKKISLIIFIASILLTCKYSYAETIVDDFTGQNIDWVLDNDHWKFKIEPGKMIVENTSPNVFGQIGRGLLVGGDNALDMHASPMRMVAYGLYDASLPFSIKIDITVLKRKNGNELGIVFDYKDSENYSAFYIKDKKLCFHRIVDKKVVQQKETKIEWGKSKKKLMNWEVKSDDDKLIFFNNGYPEMEIKGFEMENSTCGLYLNRAQKIQISKVEISQ